MKTLLSHWLLDFENQPISPGVILCKYEMKTLLRLLSHWLVDFDILPISLGGILSRLWKEFKSILSHWLVDFDILPISPGGMQILFAIKKGVKII